jgi:hypothetical protein
VAVGHTLSPEKLPQVTYQSHSDSIFKVIDPRNRRSGTKRTASSAACTDDPTEWNMTRLLSVLPFLTAVFLTASPTSAHDPNQPPHQLYKMGDLSLESGDAIKDFAIDLSDYVTGAVMPIDGGLVRG